MLSFLITDASLGLKMLKIDMQPCNTFPLKNKEVSKVQNVKPNVIFET